MKKKSNTTVIILAILLVLALIISIVINSNNSTTIKRMNTLVLQMQEQIQTTQDTLTAKEAELETANAAAAEAQTTIDTLTAEAETLKADAETAKATIESLTADNDTLKADAETTKATIEDLTAQLAAKAETVEETIEEAVETLTAEQIVETLKGITGITNANADGETVTFGIGAIPNCGTLTMADGTPAITFNADVPESQQAILTERINAALIG